HGRPYRLPFRTGGEHFYFHPDEMRRLFPDSIVRWLEEHPPASPPPRLRDKSLRPMPDNGDLPVVVAARLSLSFPGLVSAVPLWSVDPSPAGGLYSAECCWFSDGGIVSNFPVHFFDCPLPKWPTFAINLRRCDDVRANGKRSDDVWLAPTNGSQASA